MRTEREIRDALDDYRLGRLGWEADEEKEKVVVAALEWAVGWRDELPEVK